MLNSLGEFANVRIRMGPEFWANLRMLVLELAYGRRSRVRKRNALPDFLGEETYPACKSAGIRTCTRSNPHVLPLATCKTPLSQQRLRAVKTSGSARVDVRGEHQTRGSALSLTDSSAAQAPCRQPRRERVMTGSTSPQSAARRPARRRPGLICAHSQPRRSRHPPERRFLGLCQPC